MKLDLAWAPAREEDIGAINSLVGRSIRALHSGYYAEDVIEEAVQHAYGVDWQLIRDGTYFIATRRGTIVGAGGWSYRQTIAGAHGPDDLAAAPLDPAQHPARVRAFYIDPDFARQGVGALLLAVSEEAARKAAFETAELTSTIPAIPFYAAHGYQDRGRFDFRLPSGKVLDLRQMSKQLA